MESLSSTAMPRSALRRGSHRAVAITLLTFGLLVAGLLAVSPAQAETGAPPEPPPVSSAPPSIEILSPANGAFVGSATASVSGTRSENTEVRLSSAGVVLCELPADSGTSWSCDGVALESGASIPLRAEALQNGTVVASFERTVDVLRPPLITGGATNAEVSNGIIRGSGYPGASVTATLNTGESCGFMVDSGGSWSCLLPGGIGDGDYTVTATQSAAFAGGAQSDAGSAQLRIDTERPPAPGFVLSAPSARAGQAVRLSGTGEAGARVTVFAGSSSLCEVPVDRKGWACTVILGAGTFELRAVQQDAAGNVSTTSSSTTLTVAEAAVPPVVPTTPSASPGAKPPVPSDHSLAPVADPRSNSAPPTGTNPGAAVLPPAGWNDSTNFAPVAPVGGGDSWLWPRSIAIALGGLLLLAIPVRLLANALGPARYRRIRGAFAGLAGRNRRGAEFEVAPTLRIRPWAIGAGVVAVAASFTVLARPIQNQPAYLRLVLAVVIALAVLNLLVVGVGVLIARLRWRERVHAVISPKLLVVVAAASLLSRLLELSPPLLFGVVAGVGITLGSSERRQAIVGSGALASARVTTLLLVGAAAWTALDIMPGGGGFMPTLLTELVGTLALAGLGSATILLLPLGTLDGRVILARSPIVWVGLTVLSGTLLAAALTPSIPLGNGVVTTTTALIALAFGVICVVVWAWARLRTPRLR